MPYTIRKSKSKKDKRPYKIIRKADGMVVGSSIRMKDAKGSIAHRMDAESAKKPKGMKKRVARMMVFKRKNA